MEEEQPPEIKIEKGSILWWRGRTTLEKFLFVLVIVLLALAVLLLVFVGQLASERKSTPASLVPDATTLPTTVLPTTMTTTTTIPTTTTTTTVPATEKKEPDVCTTKGCVRAANYLLDAMNVTADPCANFFEYACGQWNYDHPIPDDTPVSGTFSYVRDIVRQQLRVSLEADAPSKSRSVRIAKLAYKICMNTSELEEKKSKPLLDGLQTYGGWPVMMGGKWTAKDYDITRILAKTRHEFLYEFGSEPFFAVFIYADSKNTTRNTIILDQGSLTLGRGTRDYYLNNTMFAAQMAAFQKFIYKFTMILLGDAGIEPTTDVNRTIQEIVDFETKMAEIQTPEDDRRNSTRQYNMRTFSDLYDLMPQVDWVAYFKIIAPSSVHDLLSNETEIIVQEIDYMKRISALIAKTEPRVITNYLLWRVVFGTSKYLDDRYEDVRHELNRVMTGQQMRSPRWKECTGMSTTFFPHTTGAIYVEEHFDSNDKKEAIEMIANIRKSFVSIVTKNDWMDEGTKKTAIEKANSMLELIGYPDFILDQQKLDDQYKNIDILETDSYYEMVKKVIVYTSNKDFNKLKKPFDKLEFDVSPAVVNAFYSTERNSITFPAGILQPPFFSGSFPKAINYGAIGAVIGHEITHGFDDQGSQYDKNGNLVNWWSEQSSSAFETRKQCIIDQYSNYSVPETDLRVNGKLTLGENIADNGGVKEAYMAYRAHIDARGGEEPRLPGLSNLSNDQIFFLSYANFWCGHKTKAAAIQQILQDEHSPEIFRVIGVLSNFPAFAEAFNCPLNSNLNPEKKCTVW